MNLSQLEVLVAIVDTGNLTEGAEDVGLTQSAVSYSLSRLEAELGVTLLERGRQGVTVTRIGEEVLQHARSILTQVDIIRQKAARERGLSVGKLRFGCVPTVPPRLLTGILRDFQQKYPDIQIVLFDGTPRELMEWLTEGVIDIGTVVAPDSYALAVPFATSEIKLIVSPDHRFAKQAVVPMDSLANETFIGPKADYGVLNTSPGLARIPLPRFRHEVSTQTTIFAMVRENMGISFMPEMLIDPEISGIAALSLAPQVLMNVYLATNTQSPAAEAFLTNAHGWAKSHGFLPDNA
jgi:DNA-binding transcriptional LysR family regulator